MATSQRKRFYGMDVAVYMMVNRSIRRHINHRIVMRYVIKSYVSFSLFVFAPLSFAV